MIDDPVNDAIVFNKCDDLHPTLAFRTHKRIDLLNFPDHFSPTPACNKRGLFINDRRMSRVFTFLELLAAMGIRIETIINFQPALFLNS